MVKREGKGGGRREGGRERGGGWQGGGRLTMTQVSAGLRSCWTTLGGSIVSGSTTNIEAQSATYKTSAEFHIIYKNNLPWSSR